MILHCSMDCPIAAQPVLAAVHTIDKVLRDEVGSRLDEPFGTCACPEAVMSSLSQLLCAVVQKAFDLCLSGNYKHRVHGMVTHW